MKIECICGATMSDVCSPNDVENLLISDRSQEILQDLVDSEVECSGRVDEWPEHWENCKALEVWKCHNCQRLHVLPNGPHGRTVVYKIEQVGENGDNH